MQLLLGKPKKRQLPKDKLEKSVRLRKQGLKLLLTKRQERRPQLPRLPKKLLLLRDSKKRKPERKLKQRLGKENRLLKLLDSKPKKKLD